MEIVMKNFFLTAALLVISFSGFSQLQSTPVCPPFKVDVLGGTVNKLSPRSTAGEVEKTLPCFSEKIAPGDSVKCAGVFYKDQGVYFYTERNYIEVRDNYKGAITIPFGTPRASLFSTLGRPKLKDPSWEAYQTEYGTLVMYFDAAGKLNKIQMSTKGTETLKLCN